MLGLMQIVPNLLVRDVERSVRFYTSVVGLKLSMSVDAKQQFQMNEVVSDAVFVTLESDDGQLMLQTAESLAEDLDVFAADQEVSPSGTIYLRGLDPASVLPKLSPDQLIHDAGTTWYGMREIYFRDPDGHVLCAGKPAEAPAP